LNELGKEEEMFDSNELIIAAIYEARKGLNEGGIPIGSVLADENGKVIARGHNRRVQNNDTTAHAEIECIRNAGRRRDWSRLTLVTTLSPCPMYSGAALLFKIPRVLIGENKTFIGAEDWLAKNGVELIRLDNQECINLMSTFIKKNPELWNEDIGI
jgi:cytosine/creatinine deaminase